MLLSNELGSSMASINLAKGFLGNWRKTRDKMKGYSLFIKVYKLCGGKNPFLELNS